MGSDRIEYKFLIELAELLDKYKASISSVTDLYDTDPLVEFDVGKGYNVIETGCKFVYSSNLLRLAERYKND